MPPSARTAGPEVVEVAEAAGLFLDPWQCNVLNGACGEREDGTWAALEVGLEVPRQNGKGGTLEARQLAGMFLFEEKLQIHSAHQHDTSLEHYRRLLQLIEETPDFEREVLKASLAHGVEGIELRRNRRIRFRTRGGRTGGGRGFSGETIYLDEAMYIKLAIHGALFPVMSAQPNAQIWYAGSAVDQEVHEDGVVFAQIRERGLWEEDPRLAWFGWGFAPASPKDEELRPEDAGELLDDREVWAGSNPALSIRIDEEFIEAERRSLSSRNFAIERLGIGDWPSTEEHGEVLISEETWDALEHLKSQMPDPVTLAFDVTPDRSYSSIGVAGVREDGKRHGEVIDHKRGTGWVVDRLEQLHRDWRPSAIVCDGAGPAASLIPQLEQRGIEVTIVNAKEYAQACGTFYDSIEQDLLRHLGQPELSTAVMGATQRKLGEAWAWSRRDSTVDISPLVAVTLALWGAIKDLGGSVWERRAEESAEAALL